MHITPATVISEKRNSHPEKRFLKIIGSKSGQGLVGLNYNRWDVCKAAVTKGIQEDIYLYQFLRDPLIRRFGETWYQELLDTVKELKAQGYL